MTETVQMFIDIFLVIGFCYCASSINKLSDVVNHNADESIKELDKYREHSNHNTDVQLKIAKEVGAWVSELEKKINGTRPETTEEGQEQE